MSDTVAIGDANNPEKMTESDVISAYRWFFDRDPESADVIENHLKAFGNKKAFRLALANSEEFKRKFFTSGVTNLTTKPLNWPPIKVDVAVSSEQLIAMVRLVEGNWEALGQSEPHWSVLTNDRYKADKLNENEKIFYETGKNSFNLMTAAAARCGMEISDLNTCFELGCGVGRVTVWLAQQFRNVIAVDISRPHLLLAEEAAQNHAANNINFLHVNSLHALRDVPRFDCFYSVIVLQHNPPPVIHEILDILLSKLLSGGIAYFQVPTYRLGYSFDVDKYLNNAKISGQMEVHVLPQHALFALFAKHKCRILEIREDNWTGGREFISNSFLVQKMA